MILVGQSIVSQFRLTCFLFRFSQLPHLNRHKMSIHDQVIGWQIYISFNLYFKAYIGSLISIVLSHAINATRDAPPKLIWLNM